MECDMKKINIKAYAKINLSLDVLGLKDDGFHNVSMVMQQIDIGEDEVARGAAMEREKKLRGLIFLGGRSDCAPEDMGTITVPFVCCSFTNSFGTLSKSEYSSVSIEDFETASRAVRELHRLGHRRIAALISESGARSRSELRYHGYTTALR